MCFFKCWIFNASNINNKETELGKLCILYLKIRRGNYCQLSGLEGLHSIIHTFTHSFIQINIYLALTGCLLVEGQQENFKSCGKCCGCRKHRILANMV